MNIARSVALSKHPAARAARRLIWAVRGFSLPAPRAVVVPALYAYIAGRTAFYFLKRVFVCEPLFKAYCTRYGRGLRTDVYVHYVDGMGRIVVGDFVELDGKSSFTFSPRFSANPTLTIGDHTHVGHGCSFTVCDRVTIGRHCLLAGAVWVTDSNGHPTDPADRLAGLPPPAESVRPVAIEDNVWIGGRAIILPGVTVGEGSIVAAGSVVRKSVPPYSVVAGNPAVKVADLQRPEGRPQTAAQGVETRGHDAAAV